MTQELKSQLIARLMKEDKHGLAYCLDHMYPANTGMGITHLSGGCDVIEWMELP